MVNCPVCGSENVWKKGKEFRNNLISQRYKCKDCPTNFYEDVIEESVTECQEFVQNAQPTDGKERTWVIGSIINDTVLNQKFYNTIQSYCKHNNAQLLIKPIKYDQNGTHEYNYPEELEKYFISENIKLANGLKLLAGMNINPAIGNPLTGFENFSQGDSLILSHPQMMMKSIAVNQVDHGAIMYTTGAITNPTYTQTKQGCKAEYNHSFSVLVVEEDFEINGFHIRSLNSSEDGSFYDLDCFYNGEQVTEGTTIDAIVLGDEHIVHKDDDVTAATFTNENSIIKILKPKKIIRHDVLDFYSGSHHHKHNIFLKFAKHISGKDDVEKELSETIKYILDTTPENTESVIIASNHNSHLLQWLNECNEKLDPRNALFYHELMVLMLKQTKMNGSMATFPNPFELWFKSKYSTKNIKFIGEQDSYKLHDIELGYHSHKGVNGSKGSAVGFSKLGSKTIIGHSHSPCIIEGCYQVGVNANLKLDYALGPSSWNHADCIIHKNGKRQMIFIINGKWRR